MRHIRLFNSQNFLPTKFTETNFSSLLFFRYTEKKHEALENVNECYDLMLINSFVDEQLDGYVDHDEIFFEFDDENSA